MRQALTNSLNIATVKVAELVGYGRVVKLPGRWEFLPTFDQPRLWHWAPMK